MSHPEQLGPYRILGVLGKGGMGVVYRAKGPLEREVALKLASNRPSGARLERFRREAEVTAALVHPNIVKVHAAGDLDGRPYITYELVPEARGLLEVAQGLEIRERVELLRDAARAAGFAHQNGVVHRDLKPDNILVDGEGRVKLADFGLAMARDLERITKSGTALGTPYYMAPEQIRPDRGAQGPPTDVWALGVLLHQVLSDALPFDADTYGQLTTRICEADPVPLTRHSVDAPLALEAVVRKALSKAPEDRYSDGTTLAAELDRFLEGRQVEALYRPPRDLRPWAAVVAGVLLLGSLTALLASWLQPTPDTEPPTLSIQQPAASLGPTVRLEGRVVDSASQTMKLHVEGREPTEVESGPFSLELEVPPGVSRLEVWAEDAAGNRSEPVIVSARRWQVPDWYLTLPEERRAPLPLPEGVSFAGERTYRNEVDDSLLVWVSPGSFRMGYAKGELRERPVHEVKITRGYFIGLYEVSWGQFVRFCEAKQRKPPKRLPGLKQAKRPDDHPVVNVSWNDAQEYCAWAGLRLPTEAEWELAARGTDGRLYPWGREPPSAKLANVGGGNDDYALTSPVGAFSRGASPCGALDMAGNVWEWVQDYYQPEYTAERQVDPVAPRVGGSLHPTRGGSYAHPGQAARSTQRGWGTPGYSEPYLGFRVALSGRVAPR